MYRAWKAEFQKKQLMAARDSKYRRVLLLSTDGGLHADFAFKYYCEHVQKDGDYMILLYCPKMMGVENLHTDELKKDVVATRLGQLVLEENQRFRKDAEIIEAKLRDKKLDGEVQIGVAGISPGEAIVETSKKEKVSLIILGARRLGKELQQGGTTKQYVIRNAKVPILVCKHGKYDSDKKNNRKGLKRLVVAGSDGQMHATEALKYYKANIYKEGDFLLLTYIPVSREVDTGTRVKAVMDKSEHDIQKERQELYADDAELLKEFISDELKMPGEVLIGAPDAVAGEAILDVAKREGADLIVVGSRGLGPGAFAAGPRTSDTVVNNSEVSVFVNKC